MHKNNYKVTKILDRLKKKKDAINETIFSKSSTNVHIIFNYYFLQSNEFLLIFDRLKENILHISLI